MHSSDKRMNFLKDLIVNSSLKNKDKSIIKTILHVKNFNSAFDKLSRISLSISLCCFLIDESQLNITSLTFQDAYISLLLSYNQKRYKAFYFNILSLFFPETEKANMQKISKTLRFSICNPEEIDSNFIKQIKSLLVEVKYKEVITFLELSLLRNTSLSSKMAFFGLMALIFGKGKIDSKVRIATLHIISFYGSDRSSYESFFKDLSRIIIHYPSNSLGYEYNNSDQVQYMINKLLIYLENTEIHYLNLYITQLNALEKAVNEQKREVLNLYFNQNNDLLTINGFIQRVTNLT